MKNLIILISVFILLSGYSNAQSWQWAKQIGSSYQGYERISNVFCDDNNIYVVGSYGSSLIFPADTLTSNGNNDIFISKFDQNGNSIWLRTIGGNSISISVNEDGFGSFDTINHWFYISGTIVGTAYFGNGVSLSANNGEDAFIAKFDSSGSCQWARLISSPGRDNSYCFVQPDGNILVAGKLSNNGFVGTLSISAGGFFARFDPNGNLLWAEHKFSGPEKFRFKLSFIGTDIVMTGVFDVNNSTLDTSTLILAGSANGFLARLDSIGQVKWIHTFSGPGINEGAGLKVDASSNIYVTGGFQDSIQLGSLKLYDTGKDFFLSKFDENGNNIWGVQANCDGNYAAGLDVVMDFDGNCFLTGLFSGNAQFGSFSVSTSNIYDMFIAKYNSNGACLGIKNFGQASGSSIALDSYNNIICSGAFLNTVNIGSNNFTSFGGQDIYLAKIDEIVGIEEGRLSNSELNIYANPNNGTCIIQMPDEFVNDKNVTLSIYDATGKIIQQQILQTIDGRFEINIEQKSKGVYPVVLSNLKKSYSGKIVFE